MTIAQTITHSAKTLFRGRGESKGINITYPYWKPVRGEQRVVSRWERAEGSRQTSTSGGEQAHVNRQRGAGAGNQGTLPEQVKGSERENG